MLQSMSRAGDCFDNAMLESLSAKPKRDTPQGLRFRTHGEARTAVFEWIKSGTSERSSTAHAPM